MDLQFFKLSNTKKLGRLGLYLGSDGYTSNISLTIVTSLFYPQAVLEELYLACIGKVTGDQMTNLPFVADCHVGGPKIFQPPLRP